MGAKCIAMCLLICLIGDESVGMRIVFIILATMSFGHASAQYGINQLDEKPSWHLEGYFNVGIPIGEFGDNLEQNGFGGGASLLYNVQGPIWLGVAGYGSRYDNYGITYLEQGDNELFEIEELTATRLARVYAVFRFQPLEDAMISPYIEGGMGWHWIFTNTKLTDVEFDEQIDRFNELRDNRLGFGLSAGARISPKAYPAVGLDLRVGYVYNAQVEYMRYNPDIPLDPNAFPVEAFEIRESPIEIITIDIGVSFRF